MASIHDQNENNFLASLLTTDNTWIGLNRNPDPKKKKNYILSWTDGTKVNYGYAPKNIPNPTIKPWNSKEPNHLSINEK